MSKWGPAGACATLLLAAFAAPAEESDIQFKGYYKNLLVSSRTVAPLPEDYTLDLNRVRLEARGRPTDWLGFEVQYDHEAFLGSFLDTAQFRQLKTTRPATYWDLEDDYLDRGSVFARQRLYRGFVTLNAPVADFLIGRQRVAWGSGRFWSPTDLLNPINPIALEREERQGVDAALIQWNLGPLSRLSIVYAPQRDASSSKAAQYRTNVAATDVAVTVGEFRGARVVGLDIVGRVGEGGLRTEATRTNPENSPSYTRLVAGLDYAFKNTLNLSVEYYYNGQGARSAQGYDFGRLFAGTIQNVARHYVGVSAKYDLTPLLRWDTVAVANLDDGSRFISPSLTYSITSNLDWSNGVQFFGGADRSEYGSFHNLYYTYLQYFF